jgi:serine/threonine-protein kinase
MTRLLVMGIVGAGVLISGNVPGAWGDDQATANSNAKLAEKAENFLRNYCYDCHGGPGDQGTRLTNVLDPKVLLAKPENAKKKPYVIPGDFQNSDLWLRAGKPPDYRMPPDEADKKPTDDERKVLEAWIKAGAPLPTAIGRTPPFIDDSATLTTIRNHLRDKISAADRPFQRYLILVNLHNNPTILDESIRIHRAAIAKLLNSLSWEREITVPAVIDAPAGTILNFDLRAYGFTPRDWSQIEKSYPYGVSHSNDPPVLEIETEIAKLTHTRLPILRGDWFVATVSRPPLYDQLLKLPASLTELEIQKLGVHLDKNFRENRLKRGGLVTSGVSRHNRLVERHPTPFGAYWRSYDFKTSAGRGNLLLFPLGPRFRGNEFDDQAFEQAGGEVIFNLPNGLQGYMLADAKDTRLDAPAPIGIVSDKSETSGTPEIINGLSCLACHSSGMKPFRDEIRQHPAVFDAAKEKVREIHPTTDEMDKLLARDEELFLAKLDEAMGNFLRSGDLAKADIRELVKRINEPIGAVARAYNKDLNPAAVAAELGLPNVDALKSAIQNNPKLEEYGLGPLLDAKALKRELWADDPELSLFHKIARQVRRVSPNTSL